MSHKLIEADSKIAGYVVNRTSSIDKTSWI